MKLPDKIVTSIHQVTNCIKSGDARSGFVLQYGYEKWLEDLIVESDNLKCACVKALKEIER